MISEPHNCDRIMAWGPGYSYVEHRPPTVHDQDGMDVRKKGYVSSTEMERQGIYLYHFSHLFPRQVMNKASYYSRIGMYPRMKAVDRWARECYLELKRPFRVHDVYGYISWLERYSGPIPLQVRLMMEDIRTGRIKEELRGTDDVERLLGTWWYPPSTRALKWWAEFITTPIGNWIYRWLNSVYIRLPCFLRVFDPPF